VLQVCPKETRATCWDATYLDWLKALECFVQACFWILDDG
jgi:hypothetical protein